MSNIMSACDDDPAHDEKEEYCGLRKFPSIEKFRHLLESIPRVFSARAPTSLTFRGTVKLHGTNAGIVKWYKSGVTTIQSRNRVLASRNGEWTSLGADNAGSRAFLMERDPDDLIKLVERALEASGRPPPSDHLAVFGELCGGNVQKHVAIAKLPKMFVVFAIQVDRRWLDLGDFAFEFEAKATTRIYSARSFRTETVVLDVADPEPARLELERLTAEVDAQCPVAMQLGGVVGVGEGWVWQCLDQPGCQSIWFKTKGEAHAGPPPKNKVPRAVRVASEVDPASGAEELVERHVNEALLIKGTREMPSLLAAGDMRSLTAFIEWVYADVLKEEGDTMAASNISAKDVRRIVSRVAAAWYKKRYAI